MNINEKLLDLGIKKETISRIPQIINPICSVGIYYPDVNELNTPKNRKILTIKWENSGYMNGGKIEFILANRITREGFWAGTDGFITGYAHTEYSETWPPTRNPFEGLSSFFSLIATINLAAIIHNTHIKHVEIANDHSIKMFERMRNSGIYTFADRNGKVSRRPIETDHGVLYTTTYPFLGLETTLGRFSINEAAEKIGEL